MSVQVEIIVAGGMVLVLWIAWKYRNNIDFQEVGTHTFSLQGEQFYFFRMSQDNDTNGCVIHQATCYRHTHPFADAKE